MKKDELLNVVKAKIGDASFVVASNREPYMHVRKGERIQCIRPASGMAVALDSIMRACGGLWVAHGSGNADREFVDGGDGLMVPAGDERYRLRRVWMNRKEEEGYYDIISNEMFWPLCHTVYVRPKYNEEAWQQYMEINRRFVDAILDEIEDKNAFVWFQDFHLALAPKMLKEKKPDILTAHFWHVPWPHPERFRSCPWKNEILESLLANDLIGFHTRYNCNNFLDSVDRSLEAKCDRAEYFVSYSERKTFVRPFPVSVDFERIAGLSDKSVKCGEVDNLRKRYNLHDKLVFLGVERIDYTKGIPEKIKAFKWFLRDNPEFREKAVLIQVGAPSRIRLEEYRRIMDEISELVEDVNWEYGTDRWSPIIYLPEHHDFDEVVKYYRLADYCIVSSLHDGMNLVAKEYVAAKTDSSGMLVLSEFAGASEELMEAVQVNPYDTKSFAGKLQEMVKMSDEEKERRMKKMRGVVEERNIYMWAANVISSLARLS